MSLFYSGIEKANEDIPVADCPDKLKENIDANPSDINSQVENNEKVPEMTENADVDKDPENKPLTDDNGEKISDAPNHLAPNKTFTLNGIEYKTDDNGKVYCCDGVCISNDSYVIDGHRYYSDDNGKNYRIDNRLLPDCEYEVSGYKYHTDSQGRIISAEGTLKLQDPKSERHMETVRNYDGQNYKDTDDRGHLIGHQFGGSDRLENLIPQDAKINENDFRFFEAELAKAVSERKEVRVIIEPVYEDDTNRPTAIVVTYSIDGETSVRIFPNSSEED